MIRHCRASILLSAALLLFSLGILPASTSYTGLVAFGDSLTDQGNTISYFMPPSWQNQTGYDMNYYNAAYNSYGVVAQGRWSSGATWIEYLHGNLQSSGTGAAPSALGKNWGLGSLTTDYGAGTNFAYGGSTTSTGYTNGALSNLQQQISDFVSLTGNSNSALHGYDIDGALYTVWSGGNDVIYWVEGTRTTTVDAAATTSANNVQAAITALYDAGARHFLMANLPDLGQKPNYIGTQHGTDATAYVNSFNTKLADVVLTLKTTHTDIAITYFDAHTQFNLLLDHPSTYGFENDQEAAYVFTGSTPSSTIVADPTKYVFWDNTHPTTQAHQLLGNFAYEALTIPEPGSAAVILIGGLLLISRRKIR